MPVPGMAPRHRRRSRSGMNSNGSAHVPRDARSGIVITGLEQQTLARGVRALRVRALRDTWAGSHDLAREQVRHADVLAQMPIEAVLVDRESAQVIEINADGPPAARMDRTPRAVPVTEPERQAIIAAYRTFRDT